MKNIFRINNHMLLVSVLIVTFLCGCERYLSIAPPIDKISSNLVFNNNDAAKSAITGIYSRMSASGFASGGLSSIMSLAGMSADEFVSYSDTYDEFYKNSLIPSNGTLLSGPWATPYSYIYSANAVLEGLGHATNVSADIKKQLEGEAKFIRAFCYFYLTNIFGDVPLVLTTNYKANASVARDKQSVVYNQIILDLSEAQKLLGNDYYTIERVRPNRWAATALLARVYLYINKWNDAEVLSSSVIANSALFDIKEDLNQVFLKNSTEAIWQLMPSVPGRNTNDANVLILSTTSAPSFISLNENLLNAFESGDKRRTMWIESVTISGKTYYHSYKYKVGSVSELFEYSMVLRLAEQYLIRAEARINQNNILLGIQDLNVLRKRARALATPNDPNPLPDIEGNIDKSNALLAVEKERRIELFSEWGHRWLDIKRTNRIQSILPSTKGSNWQDTDVLWPIPQNEINSNSFLIQNPGY